MRQQSDLHERKGRFQEGIRETSARRLPSIADEDAGHGGSDTGRSNEHAVSDRLPQRGGGSGWTAGGGEGRGEGGAREETEEGEEATRHSTREPVDFLLTRGCV